ncbi:MAG: HD domain-containing protein [Rubrobacteraceae bacterium]
MNLRSTFLATEATVRDDSRGTPYLSAKLVDSTGSIDARMWSLPEQLREGLAGPEYVYVEGNTHEYRGTLQLKVNRLRILNRDEVSEEDYLPATDKDRAALAAELIQIGEAFENENLRDLFALMVSDEGLWDAFCSAPAAKSMHHARIGGLLEHSVQCLRVARSLAEFYPVDRDLLFFGMIFHDVGKVEELSWGSGGFGYTTEGRLQGHVVLGDKLVSGYISRIPYFPKDLALQISHILLAHQGEIEYGSPAQPKTLEALLVHLIDNLDARTAMYIETTVNVSPDGWSHYDNPLRRALYVPESPGSINQDLPSAETDRPD